MSDPKVSTGRDVERAAIIVKSTRSWAWEQVGMWKPGVC